MTLSTGILLLAVALVFFGTNVYISCRMYSCFHAVFQNLSMRWFGVLCAGIVALAFLSLMRSRLPLRPSVKYALGLFGGYWMGMYVYLLLALLAADLLLLVFGMFHIIRFPVTGSIRCVSGFAAILAAAGIVIAGTIHAGNITHRAYDVSTEKITDGGQWNIALVSDLHLGAVKSEKRLEKLVDKINTLQPDLVCIAGDIFDNDFSAILDTEKCARTLRKIQAEYGVYACLGNHDAGSTAAEMLSFLPSCNITLLAENYESIGGKLVLAGRLDGSPIGGYGERKRGDFGTAVSGADRNLPVIVLDHTPSHIGEYPDWVDLILCGHTHRGQIFPGSLFTRKLFPVDYGIYRENEDSPTVIVTSGAGTWGLPMRVGSDSEIVSIHLHG